MAFGKKYFSSYKSNNNLDYYLEIFLEDYTGSALELVMGAGGPVIEYETDQEDRFSPIISSSCKIPYLVENYLDSLFIDDLRNNYQERQVYVHIYRSTQSGHSAVAPLWSGFLVMDIGFGVDKYFPYEEHLKFVDGLSLLKDIDFVNLNVSGPPPPAIPFEDRVQGNYAVENMYFGPGTYIFWIREILAKSGAALTNQGASQNYGFTTSVNWYNGEMNATGQSSDPLHKTKCAVSMFHRKDDQGVFYPDNCYNVLKELLRHWGARITYWKHEFWIVQIPEYITNETGTISTPVNNNSRLYSNTGAYQGSQNHLGSTFYTRYEQTIENDKISKLSGTKYDYLPLIKQVNADFLSFSSKSYFGGFPFGSTATTQEVFQGTINSPSAADFLYLSIPLDWTWDMSQAGNVNNNLSAGHTMGWWCAVKFNFYASDGTTTYYLQYNFSDGSYYWVDSALWTPLGGKSPKYTISSKLAVVSGWVGFEEKIPFQDENGSAISMTGAWSFFLDIEDYGTSSSNPGSFYCNFSGYTGYGNPTKMRNPQTNTTIVSPLGVPLKSGTVSWSNTLVDQQGQVTISTINNPAGFNAGTVNPDIRFATTSPFTGLLQTLNNAQSASNGETFNVINSNLQAKQNSEQFDFGTLLWGDSLEFAPSSLQVFNGSTYVNTEPSGEWGRGILTGTKTFTKMLIDEFFSGQTKIIISPSMRLAVGVANKNEDQSGTLRPRYVNPIGKLRETRDGTDPEYFFRRGSFYTLLDEWDYEGYEIIRNVPTTTTQSNGMGSMGGSQSGSPAPSGMLPSPMVQALSQNSPLAYIRATIPATGSNVAVNGNFNTAVGWSLGSGWSIDTTAKKAKFAATGSTSELTQSVLTQGLTYQVNFKVEVTAGTLLVKAGTSGTSQSITSSGDYSIYLDCEGSSLIKFQAGTTFTGNLTFITLKDQKSLSSVPIEAIGTAVFKTGDTFNLINSNDDTILPLTVTSNQGSGDTTISVSSTPLYEDIDNGSYLLINQDDLSEQYQNKTKGTVAGFDITATGIAKSSINITDWLNSDTMTGATVNNVPTALSVKNYVDGQVGASDTLQEVTDNGNTTTNSIMVGSSSSPSGLLHISSGTSGDAVVIIESDTDNNNENDNPQLQFKQDGGNTIAKLGLNGDANTRFTNSLANAAYFGNDEAAAVQLYTNLAARVTIDSNGNMGINTNFPTEKLHVVGDILATGDSHADAFKPEASSNPIKFKNFGSTELARITDGGNLLIGTTTDSGYKLNVNGTAVITDNLFIDRSSDGSIIFNTSGVNKFLIGYDSSPDGFRIYNYNTSSASLFIEKSTNNLGIGTTSPSSLLHLSSTTPIITNESSDNSVAHGIEFKNSGSLDAYIKQKPSTGEFEFNVGRSSTWGGDFLFTTDTYDSYRITKDLHRWYILGSEKMRLTSGGNVGIGTTNPLQKLSVNGVINSDTNDSYYGAWMNGNSAAGQDSYFAAGTWYNNAGYFKFIQSGTPHRLSIYTYNTADHLTFQEAGGNVGIGTTSPSVALEIGTNNNVENRLKIHSDKDAAYLELQSLGNVARIEATNGTNLLIQSSGPSGYVTFNTAGSERMRLWSTGNLLLGTTTDSGEKLVVNGNAKFADQVTIPATPVASTDAASKSYVDAQVSATDSLQEVTTVGNTTTNSVMIGSSSSPSSTLEVYSSTNPEIKISNGGGTSPNPKLTFYRQGGVSANIQYDVANKILMLLNDYAGDINFHSGGSEKMRLTSGGNLLLGTTTDSGGKIRIEYAGGSPNGMVVQSTSNRSKIAIADNNTVAYVVAEDSFASYGMNDSLSANNLNINSSGNVLIGTTTDSGYKLNVDGIIRSSSSILGTTVIVQKVTALNTNGIQFTNNGGSEKMRILDSGNVLIGTTSDSGGKLNIQDGYIMVNGGTTSNTNREAVLWGRSQVGASIAQINVQGDQWQFGGGGVIDTSPTLILDYGDNSANFSGNVSIGGTAGAVYKLDVVGKARVQSVFELDDVLTLNAITTPADPASGKSSIYMDSADGAIKVKINVGGTVVTRTIASFE